MRRAMGTGHAFLLDPRALARRGGSWTGSVPVGRFARVADLVESDATTVEVRLHFELDPEGRCRVYGDARLRAGVPCRRCARTVGRDIETDIDLLVLSGESEAQALTPRYDTCVVTGQRVAVEALVEDDVLLGLPEYGCAAGAECPDAHSAARHASPAGESGNSRSDRPFAALAELVGRR